MDNGERWRDRERERWKHLQGRIKENGNDDESPSGTKDERTSTTVVETFEGPFFSNELAKCKSRRNRSKNVQFL